MDRMLGWGLVSMAIAAITFRLGVSVLPGAGVPREDVILATFGLIGVMSLAFFLWYRKSNAHIASSAATLLLATATVVALLPNSSSWAWAAVFGSFLLSCTATWPIRAQLTSRWKELGLLLCCGGQVAATVVLFLYLVLNHVGMNFF